MSYAWSCLEADYSGVSRRDRINLITVNGTAVGWQDGPPADLARAVSDEDYLWLPAAYASATFPMLPSRREGESEVRRRIATNPGRFVLAGYSQGALITDTVARDLTNPADELHHRLKDLVSVITWGDPMRCPGIARGNEIAGQPLPTELDGEVTGGIAGAECLTPEQTAQLNVVSFANDGDLYAAAPVSADPWTHMPEVGHIENMIYQVIQEITVQDVWAVIEEVAKVIFMPFAYLVPMVQAIWNAGMFFVQGMGAPHYHYENTIDPAMRYLHQTATKVLT
jgi:hypothetical protein